MSKSKQSFWQSMRFGYARKYDYRRLLDYRVREPIPQDEGLTHFICDIDKTYLETSFEKFAHLVKIAFEDAEDKQTVLGATEVLMEMRWPHGASLSQVGVPRPLNFVSSSPPQLRNVLSDKMILDGLNWTSDTFKNQVYNLLSGRVDMLRQHVVYKTAAILQVFKQAGPMARFYLIGDNAESDAFIYLGVSLFVGGTLSPEGFQRYLQIGGVDKESAASIVHSFAEAPQVNVCGIFIRKLPEYTLADVTPISGVLKMFNSYFELALLLIKQGLVPAGSLWRLVKVFHNQHGLSSQQIRRMLQEHLSVDCDVDFKESELKPFLQSLSASDFVTASQDPIHATLSGYSESNLIEAAKNWVRV